ncbi:MAG TPA: hypothetical protein DEA05_01210 [Rhodobacteraceae bacterium]|nr:hypothetical protein [Paracoccaceae bacterium]
MGRAVRPAERVRAIGLASIIGYGAFFVGPAAMGLVAELYGLPWAFALVAGVLALTAAVIVPTIARHMALRAPG